MTETEPQNRRLGYARVSTHGQTLEAQLEQLKADKCARIYREKASGAKADRKELLRMLDRLAPGDVVTVTRIDRLARSTFVSVRSGPWAGFFDQCIMVTRVGARSTGMVLRRRVVFAGIVGVVCEVGFGRLRGLPGRGFAD